MRRAGLVIVEALLGGMLGLQAQSSASQSIPRPSTLGQVAPVICTQGLQAAASEGSIHGTVTDSGGDVIVGARVTLEEDGSKVQHTVLTGDAGSFKFAGLVPGKFGVTITSTGFADWVGPGIVLPPGGSCEVTGTALSIAPVNTDVEVVVSNREVAEEQLKAQETQRVLGVIPNFYTSYVWHAEPLTPKQKFRLALRSSVDPATFVLNGAFAGIEQWQNYFSGYGQGSEGYAKRYAASYADGFISTMIGGAILPSVLHQDPRYFYKGKGSIRSRALYAISTVVICKGDNGRWQPNYSNVIGNLASAGISILYYPDTNRNGAQETIDNALIGTAEGAISALIQEFVLRKISRGNRPSSSGHQ